MTKKIMGPLPHKIASPSPIKDYLIFFKQGICGLFTYHEIVFNRNPRGPNPYKSIKPSFIENREKKNNRL